VVKPKKKKKVDHTGVINLCRKNGFKRKLEKSGTCVQKGKHENHPQTKKGPKKAAFLRQWGENKKGGADPTGATFEAPEKRKHGKLKNIEEAAETHEKSMNLGGSF